jgi:hypothetical protein
MGRSGYDTTNPASYRSAAAYNAIAMHRAQKLLEQVSKGIMRRREPRGVWEIDMRG